MFFHTMSLYPRPCYPPYNIKHSLWMTYFSAYWGDPVTDQCRWSSETTNQLLELKDELVAIIEQMVRKHDS